MLRFFRTLRRKFLQRSNEDHENTSISRYLLYAIGEITLVIIGILFALQINNWNENRKMNIEKQQAYSQLKEEFQEAKRTFLTDQEAFSIIKSATYQILLNTGVEQPGFTSSTFDSLLFYALEPPAYNPTFILYREIMESNKIELIDDSIIKQQLYVFQKTMTDLKVKEGITAYFINEQSVPYLNEKIAFKNIDLYSDYVKTKRSLFLKDNRGVLMDLKFENLLDNQNYTLQRQYGIFSELGKQIDAILNRLDALTLKD